ncbi:MAG: phosphatase PAP2 family protein [Bacteriovoracaceae bacterium]|nr:phosphatase PAP2 family protein [Bacteriovoracaceae bacterium]
MRTLAIFLFLIVTNFSSPLYAEEKAEYTAPGAFDFLTMGPQTLKEAWKISFRKEALPAWGVIAGTTALTYYYDEEMLLEVQRMGRRLGIGNHDHTTGAVTVGGMDLIRVPTDFGSTMYYFGDGWTHLALSFGFMGTGALTDDNRALQTGNQILHGMIWSTVPNQMLKRSFGRESPYRRSEKRGAWRPFPSPSTYNNNVSKYDAMPSGHVMTLTMSLTVIDSNYPEYKLYTRSIGGTMLTLLSLQMMNNGVHWASDYPLGIAMGYVFGKVVSRQGKTVQSGKGKVSNFVLLPYHLSQNGQRVSGFNMGFLF